MASDELREDPFTWAFARAHMQIAPGIQKRYRRTRALRMSVAGLIVLLVSVAGSSVMWAESEELVGFEGLGDGSGVLTVRPGADGEDVAEALQALFDDQERDLEVGWITGRAEIEGRILPEGDRMVLLDRSFAHDNTGLRIWLAADAVGTVLVSVPVVQGTVSELAGNDLACVVVGLLWPEAEAVARSMGYRSHYVDDATTPEDPELATVVMVVTYGDTAAMWVADGEPLLLRDGCPD